MDKDSEQYRMMSVIEAGHVYQLSNVGEGVQTVSFIKKEPVEEGSTELKTVQDGTTNEAVLDMMAHRLGVLHSEMPDGWTKEAQALVEAARDCLFRRTKEREERGVEGTNQA
jgi:hypothetical protein